MKGTIKNQYEPLIDCKPRILFHIGSNPPPVEPDYVRVVTIGNTFGRESNIPDGDILIHTGNFTHIGANGAFRFAQWIAELPHKYKVVVPGSAEHRLAKTILTSLTPPTVLVLDGTTTLIKGVRICNATALDIDGYLTHKPFNAVNDILISHIPPFGILDENEAGMHIGSKTIAKNIEEHPPNICLVGSPGEGHGALWHGGTLYANPCIYGWSRLDANYIKYGVPLIIDIIPEPKRPF